MILKYWTVCDRQVSGMQLLEEKNVSCMLSPHISVPSAEHALCMLIPVQVCKYTTWCVYADTQPDTFTPSNGGKGG